MGSYSSPRLFLFPPPSKLVSADVYSPVSSLEVNFAKTGGGEVERFYVSNTMVKMVSLF